MASTATQRENDKYYTYEDWLALADGNRYELLNGKLYMMASPSDRHQEILMEIAGQLWSFLKGKPCRVYPSPFDVRLNKNEDTVFQPDIIVVCDKSKISGKGCEGAPDIVIEILSPSTASYDCLIKYKEYQRSGVKEYWIVDPDNKKVFVNILKDGAYELRTCMEADTIAVQTLPECVIDLSLVFS